MRHIPEAGAVCGNSARTDLCGGRGVTSVPTATLGAPTYQRVIAQILPVPSVAPQVSMGSLRPQGCHRRRMA